MKKLASLATRLRRERPGRILRMPLAIACVFAVFAGLLALNLAVFGNLFGCGAAPCESPAPAPREPSVRIVPQGGRDDAVTWRTADGGRAAWPKRETAARPESTKRTDSEIAAAPAAQPEAAKRTDSEIAAAPAAQPEAAKRTDSEIAVVPEAAKRTDGEIATLPADRPETAKRTGSAIAAAPPLVPNHAERAILAVPREDPTAPESAAAIVADREKSDALPLPVCPSCRKIERGKESAEPTVPPAGQEVAAPLPESAPAEPEVSKVEPAGAEPAERTKVCENGDCRGRARGKLRGRSQVRKPDAGANAEIETAEDDGGLPFSISVDGEPVAGAQKPIDRKRKTGLALENVDIQVKFDGLDAKPILNVSTFPPRRAYQAGEKVDFLASWNYPAWIQKAEIRIFKKGREKKGKPLYTVKVSSKGAATWTMPAKAPAEMVYVLRVQDGKKRYDETIPLSLVRTKRKLDAHEAQGDAVAPGFGEDRTALRNIEVHGGSVTVYGRNVPGGHHVTVLGDPVPVDPDNAFVVQRILPPGDHQVDVAVENDAGKGLDFSRAINIPSSEWFYVALADLTVGANLGKKSIVKARKGEFDRIYTKGRAAFYLKGKIKGRTLLTAAADTGEDKIENLFKGLDAKDPRQFLRRLDPDDYYPVYGDDSTAIEDAPTRGKFYVRLERGDSHVMWGNFKADVSGTEFMRNERALYGANGVYRSAGQAPDGGRRTEVQAYAAQPGTLPQIDVFRSTGGSAYFLKHQDVTPGSETAKIEVRDRVTGAVIERRPLRYGHDYEMDYIQGLVLLKSPLNSTTAAGGVVRPDALGGSDVYLVVSYEFTPAAGDVDGYSYGGRGQQWVGDHVRAGVTGMSEKTGAADQTLLGADVVIRKSDGTYVEAEYARSKGPGFGVARSADGGLTIEDNPAAGARGKKADAYRVKLRADVGELTDDAVKGDLEAYYERVDGGFSSLDRQVDRDEELWGLKGRLDLNGWISVNGGALKRRIAGGKKEREIDASAAFRVDEHWSVSPGVLHSLRDDPSPFARDEGSRTDLGVKLAYEADEDRGAYVFGQVTADRSGNRRRNDRAGVGGKTLVTEKTSLSGEVSYGTAGVGALAALGYSPTADDRYYLGYRLDPDREFDADYPYSLTGGDLGVVVAGARHRFSDSLSVFAEDNYDMFGDRRSLTQTYGVTYTPDARWTIAGGLEVGDIFDDTYDLSTGKKNSDFERIAVAMALGFHDDGGIDGRLKGEVRFEDSADGTRDRTTYLFAAGAAFEISDDWRLIANLDAVFSDASTTTRDGDYFEGAIGYAYRPALNDRFNALFKYAFLYDLPGPDQVTVNGTTLGPQQLTHILSADASYDLVPWLTVGGKYGFRIGETRDRDGGSWEDASAHLGILRADFHIVSEWDALVEGRVLWTPEADSTGLGAVAAVYRHFGENLKIGIGYNFGRFSDDLRDQTFDDRGVFVNVIGKF